MEGDSSTWLAELNSKLEQELATYPEHMRRHVIPESEKDERNKLPRIENTVWPDSIWGLIRHVLSGGRSSVASGF